MPFAAEIDAGGLLEVVGVSLVAGVAITALFSLVVRWGARSAEAGRAGHSRAAMGFAALATVAFVVFAAGVVYGVQVMLTKG